MRVDTYLHIPDNSRLLSPSAPQGRAATRAAVFLDRDGVMVEDVHFLRSVAQIGILPGVIEAIRALQAHFFIIVVTNQSGIARGLLTEDDLLTIHLELVWRLAAEGAIVDAIYYCPHLPEAIVAKYRAGCACRKPKPGMLLRARQDWGVNMGQSFIVGDAARDIEAGQAAGAKGIMLDQARSAVHHAPNVASDLAQAARLILAQLDQQVVSHGQASFPVA